ncbi:MAG: thiamine pyrophosphate-binding protein, partial [Deltaproteobacteria bacterium]
IEHVASASTTTEFGEAFVEALERDDLSVIVAKVSAVGPEHYGMDLHLPENAFRFRRLIAERKRAAERAS